VYAYRAEVVAKALLIELALAGRQGLALGADRRQKAFQLRRCLRRLTMQRARLDRLLVVPKRLPAQWRGPLCSEPMDLWRRAGPHYPVGSAVCLLLIVIVRLTYHQPCHDLLWQPRVNPNLAERVPNARQPCRLRE
jgi:hypothetical protein